MPTNQAILGPLLRTRAACATVGGLGALQAILTAFGLPAMPCALKRLTGWPCAGCGLSRSMAAMLCGRFSHSVHLNAFGPLATAAVAALLLASVVSDDARRRASTTIEAMENRTRLPALLLWAFIAYWLCRLALYGRDVA